MSSSQDDERRAAWQRARRDLARRHHPDLGGDSGTYLRLLAQLDRRHGFGPPARSSTDVVIDEGRPAQWRRAARHRARSARRVVRGLRARLPRGVPGRRRYTSL